MDNLSDLISPDGPELSSSAASDLLDFLRSPLPPETSEDSVVVQSNRFPRSVIKAKDTLAGWSERISAELVREPSERVHVDLSRFAAGGKLLRRPFRIPIPRGPPPPGQLRIRLPSSPCRVINSKVQHPPSNLILTPPPTPKDKGAPIQTHRPAPSVFPGTPQDTGAPIQTHLSQSASPPIQETGPVLESHQPYFPPSVSPCAQGVGAPLKTHSSLATPSPTPTAGNKGVPAGALLAGSIPNLAILERPSSPPITETPRRKRRTRRAGRHYQTKKLYKEYFTVTPSFSVWQNSPNSSSASSKAKKPPTFVPKTEVLQAKPPVESELVSTEPAKEVAISSSVTKKGKPCIIHNEPCALRYRVKRIPWKVIPIDLPPTVYPCNIPLKDPRRATYLKKRAAILYPQTPTTQTLSMPLV